MLCLESIGTMRMRMSLSMALDLRNYAGRHLSSLGHITCPRSALP